LTRAFIGGSVWTYAAARARWECHDALIIDGADVVGLAANMLGAGMERVDIDGATIVPAFADCHVHLTDTGLKSGDRDFSDVSDAATFAARVAALPRSGFVIAGKYDDAQWPDGPALPAVLDATCADRIAMLVRVDGHSALLSRAALAYADLDPALPGIERDGAGMPTGRLFLEANWRAQVAIMSALPQAEKTAANARAAELALANGALHLHVQLVGLGDRDAYAAEIAALARAGAAKWYPKICERDPRIAHALGLPFVGGDVFLDGSIGSGTAALGQPYCAGGTGTLMHADADVEDYFRVAEELGLSAGVHAIGDRAIEQCLAALEVVLGGRPSPVGRHFIEHFELARPDHIERCARLGIYLSMQPQFDAAWGGPGGMYERRLGVARARTMNRLKTVLRSGAVLVGGADSPVCRLSPLAGMQAALDHSTPAERLDAHEALTMYTSAAARFGHVEARTGTLRPGSAADFVILDGDPIARSSFADLTVRATWSDGRCVYAAQ
jgi:predicted amidohydrolase YtcJ